MVKAHEKKVIAIQIGGDFDVDLRYIVPINKRSLS